MAALNQQRQLLLTSPDQHGEGLHPEPRHGVVLIWNQRASDRRWVKIRPSDDLAAALNAHLGGTDRYLAVNEFRSWRIVGQLCSLRACYVDLDACSSVDYALIVVDDLGLPAPTYAVSSGRGVHLYWLIEAAPAQALPVWQAIQEKLVQTIKSGNVGVDAAAKDCTRVLRLVGSVNSKSCKDVVGYITGGRYTLRALADEVLGPRQHQRPPERKAGRVVSIERQRSVSQAVRAATGTFQLWHSRYADLCTIAEHAAFMRPHGVPEGSRDKLLFLLSNALAWFVPADRIEDEVSKVARTFVPSLPLKEALGYVRPIVQRAEAAAAGQIRDWEGGTVDPRYRMRSSTIREWLGELITPEVEPRLRVLCTPERLAEREAERQKGRDRVAEGRYKKPQSVRRMATEKRRADALRLRAEGNSQRQIATTLGISQQGVSRLLNRDN